MLSNTSALSAHKEPHTAAIHYSLTKAFIDSKTPEQGIALTMPEQLPLNSTDSLRSKMRDCIIGAFIATIITLGVYNILSLALEKPIPAYIYGIIWALAALIFYFRLRSTRVITAFESWEALALVANSKPAQLLITTFSIIPLVVSVAKSLGIQQQIPFTTYLYWASGLMLFIFVLVFKATAPIVYRYKSYQDIIDQHGGLEVLREDLLTLQKMAANGLAPFDKANDHAFLAQDHSALQWLRITDRTEAPELYFLIRKYSRGLKAGWRGTLATLLFVPAFVLSTTMMGNMLKVGFEATIQTRCSGGLFKSIYGDMLSFYQNHKEITKQPTGCEKPSAQ